MPDAVDTGSAKSSEGSATVWALLVVLLIWVAAAVGSVETVAVQTRHHAGAAADAAALAAAAEGGLDPAAGCAAARLAADRAGARLTGCTMTGPYAVVTVEVSAPPPLAWAGDVSGRARAGPADTGEAGQTATTPAAS